MGAPELKFEQPERTQDQPEPNLGQPELRSGPFRLTFTPVYPLLCFTTGAKEGECLLQISRISPFCYKKLK